MPSNGITTPTPIQPGMVSNCNRFHFVKQGSSCNDVLAANSITLAQLFSWNPNVKSDCTGLWADVNVCVGIIGGTTPPPPPTTTVPSNGISTPTPIQPGMVSNCNKFHFVKQGSSCNDVLAANSISLAQLFKWNPNVKSDCSGLWASVNVCVGVIGGTAPPPTTTQPSNGIATPSPIQEGMVKNCKTFHFVAPGSSCQAILDSRKITLANFFKWNPAVKADCSGLWAQTYACVAVL